MSPGAREETVGCPTEEDQIDVETVGLSLEVVFVTGPRVKGVDSVDGESVEPSFEVVAPPVGGKVEPTGCLVEGEPVKPSLEVVIVASPRVERVCSFEGVESVDGESYFEVVKSPVDEVPVDGEPIKPSLEVVFVAGPRIEIVCSVEGVDSVDGE